MYLHQLNPGLLSFPLSLASEHVSSLSLLGRSDFKRLSQVMNFNPGETPPEIRGRRDRLANTGIFNVCASVSVITASFTRLT